MASLAASLEAIECDVAADTSRDAPARQDADAFRASNGIAPLRDEHEAPEEEFYRRARALGFRRICR